MRAKGGGYSARQDAGDELLKEAGRAASEESRPINDAVAQRTTARNWWLLWSPESSDWRPAESDIEEKR
jgi:hypothetical protein